MTLNNDEDLQRLKEIGRICANAVQIMGAATNYHADYVKPKWSRNMKRLIKIGRHIFYSDT